MPICYENPRVVSIDGLAVMLAVSKRHAQRMHEDGLLPRALSIGNSKKPPRRWRVLEIDAWIAAGCPSGTAWAQRPRKSSNQPEVA